MKVLIVEHYLPESIYTLELGRELKQYCELSIFCRKDAGVQEDGITMIPEFYPGGSNKLKAVLDYGRTLRKLAQTIRRGKFDIVHIQTFKKAKVEMTLYYRVRKYCKKLVHTVHNVLPHEASPADLKLYRDFYNFCDDLIVHNQASKTCLMETFDIPEEKITVIAHGAYQSHLSAGGTRRDDPVKRFLQFGFIRQYKGIDILLEAIARIPPDQRRRLHFTIAGKQYPKLDATDYAAKIRELGIEDCARFCPEHIPDEKLSELFENTDFVLFPYRNIYGSGALLLAYTYQKPVIASDIPTFCEETDGGRTGLLFESENPQALADAILAAAASSTEQAAAYQAAIRELVDGKYNWKKSAQKSADAYKNKLFEESVV